MFLETLAEHLGSNADVSYACAAFSTKSKLFQLTMSGELRKHTTFPTAAKLHSHKRWIYAQGGGVGLAKSDPEHVDVGDLRERVEGLRRPPDQRWSSRALISEDIEDEDTDLARAEHLGRKLEVVWDAVHTAFEGSASHNSEVAEPIHEALEQVSQDNKKHRRMATSIALVTGLLGITWMVPATADEPS